MKPKAYTLSALLIIMMGLLCLGCSKDSDEARKNLRPAGVTLQEALRGEIVINIQATGTIAPNHESYLGPKVNGRIEEFFADVGEFIEKGKPLLRLEQVRFKLALQEAEASYKENQAQLKNLQLKLERKDELFKKGIIDKQMYDDIATEVALARARADVAGSRLDRAREDMKDSVLYAPFSGFVVERKMNTGEIFSGMANEYVFHLVDTSIVKVEVNIFETKKQYISVGKKVSVAVDAVPDKLFDGAITVVNPLVDPASRKFLVKIEIANADFALESGMFARVNIPEEQRADALLVPAAALLERNGEKVVFLAKEKKAVQQAVEVGLMTHERVEILKGIAPGDRVIVDGLYAVKDGTPLLIEKK